MPFQRDALLLSLYEACRHRPAAIADATALTETVISKLVSGTYIKDGIVRRQDIVEVCKTTLAAFDEAASVHYSAFHH